MTWLVPLHVSGPAVAGTAGLADTRRGPPHGGGVAGRGLGAPQAAAGSRLRWLGAFALIALGCERAAPGPDECVAFAETWLRARRPATRLEADTAFDELVRRCLTEPYDRELVTCVVSGQNQDGCRVDYARRVEARRERRAR